jgi:competence protein ComEC
MVLNQQQETSTRFVKERFTKESFVFFSIDKHQAAYLSASSKLLRSSLGSLLAFVLGCCGTLLLHELVPQSGLLGLLLVALLLSLLAIRNSIWWPLAILILAFCYSSWIFDRHFQKTLPSTLESKNIQLVGQVVGLPDSNHLRRKFLFRVEHAYQMAEEVQGESSWLISRALSYALNGQLVQLSCYRCPIEILPNQRWQLIVRIKNPHGFASWGAFDFEKYLFRHRIVARGYVRIKQPNLFLAKSRFSIDDFRHNIRNQLNEQLADYPQGKGIIAALMIGDKSLLSQQQKTSFQRTGVSHLMAISGLHVGLVFLAIAWLLQYFLRPIAWVFDYWPRQQIVLIPSLIGAFTYSALAGFAVSTERALTMLCVFVVCRFFARDVSLLKVLLLAMVALLIIDPFSILDIGFWLSCGAVMVIAAVLQYRDSITLLRLQPMLWLGMLPMTTLFFGQVSIISPIVNLLMVPMFCLAVIPLVLIALVLDQVGLSSANTYLLELVAWFLEALSDGLYWLSQLSFASFFPPGLPIFCLLLILLAMLAYLSGWRGKHFLALITTLAIYLGQHNPFSESELRIVLLDVGQGLSMVIEAKDYVLVYDTGPAYPSGFNAAQAVLIPYLRRRGVSKIDHLIISHADNDHIGGLDALQNAFDISQILTSRVDKIPSAYACQAGQAWSMSGVEFSIVSPDQGAPQGSNNNSCVLRIDNGSYSTLITGDIEKPIERFLLNSKQSLKSDFLLVPHHGSSSSSTPGFIDAVQPKLGLIAAGYRNHYGHPHPNVVSRFSSRRIKLLSTIENGSVLLKINKKEWSYTAFRVANRRFWHR